VPGGRPSDTLSLPQGRCQGEMPDRGLSLIISPIAHNVSPHTWGGGESSPDIVGRRGTRTATSGGGEGTISVGPGTCDGMEGIHVGGPYTHPTHSSALAGSYRLPTRNPCRTMNPTAPAVESLWGVSRVGADADSFMPILGINECGIFFLFKI